MASVLFTIGGAVMNAIVFSGTNCFFSKLTDHGEKKQKIHDLALEKLLKARDNWNEDTMKRLDFIDQNVREKTEARAYINNVDKTVLEYYQVFVKQVKHLPP